MIIKYKTNSEFYLKEISVEDIENLRVWKNKFKNHFFHNQEISTAEQIEWFENQYLLNDDKMFVVKLKDKSIGCMGYRFKEGIIDVYNIMRGVEDDTPGFKMSQAFRLMLDYLRSEYDLNISCVVLNANPAFKWYLKNGFDATKDFGDYSLLEYKETDVVSEVNISQ